MPLLQTSAMAQAGMINGPHCRARRKRNAPAGTAIAMCREFYTICLKLQGESCHAEFNRVVACQRMIRNLFVGNDL